VTLASHPPGESPKSANARDLLQNMSLNRVEDFFIADVGNHAAVARGRWDAYILSAFQSSLMT
jgi:hypothetical protein